MFVVFTFNLLIQLLKKSEKQLNFLTVLQGRVKTGPCHQHAFEIYSWFIDHLALE